MEWKDGSFCAHSFELGCFYTGRTGVFRPVDAQLRPLNGPALVEVYDDADVINRTLNGAQEAFVGLYHALGQLFTRPLALRETGRVGAGMTERPRHHVLPREHREWFEKRGFTGDMDIDQLCVELEQAHHQAIHGGGNWRLGRTWPREWNRMLMDELQRVERRAGRMLTRDEILGIVKERMQAYGIPIRFVPWRGK